MGGVAGVDGCSGAGILQDANEDQGTGDREEKKPACGWIPAAGVRNCYLGGIKSLRCR